MLSRAIHLAIHPSSVNDMGARGRVVWLCITATLLALGWVIATGIPFFEYFSSILGSLQAFPTLIFPAMFFGAARKAAGRPVHKAEVALQWVLCYLLGTCLIVFGLWDSINGILASFSHLGGPFSCQCHDIWAEGCPATVE